MENLVNLAKKILLIIIVTSLSFSCQYTKKKCPKPESVNPPPTGKGQTITVTNDIIKSFEINSGIDKQMPSNSLTYQVVDFPKHGTIGHCMGLNSSSKKDRTCKYQVDNNIVTQKIDTFTYAIDNGTKKSLPIKVTIKIVPPTPHILSITPKKQKSNKEIEITLDRKNYRESQMKVIFNYGLLTDKDDIKQIDIKAQIVNTNKTKNKVTLKVMVPDMPEALKKIKLDRPIFITLLNTKYNKRSLHRFVHLVSEEKLNIKDRTAVIKQRKITQKNKKTKKSLSKNAKKIKDKFKTQYTVHFQQHNQEIKDLVLRLDPDFSDIWEEFHFSNKLHTFTLKAPSKIFLKIKYDTKKGKNLKLLAFSADNGIAFESGHKRILPKAGKTIEYIHALFPKGKFIVSIAHQAKKLKKENISLSMFAGKEGRRKFYQTMSQFNKKITVPIKDTVFTLSPEEKKNCFSLVVKEKGPINIKIKHQIPHTELIMTLIDGKSLKKIYADDSGDKDYLEEITHEVDPNNSYFLCIEDCIEAKICKKRDFTLNIQ